MQTLFHSLIITLFSVGVIAACIALFHQWHRRRTRKTKLGVYAIVVLLAGALGGGVAVNISAAETQMSEREHLARLVHELVALKPILLAAQRAPKDPGRERFKYNAINRDLKLMIDGLEDYIYRADQQPRTDITPLSGGYSE
jgi:RAQPRD family integrative conjugative element protein